MAIQKSTMQEIIRQCLEIDSTAVHVYEKFATLAPSAAVADFFKTMRDDETRHVSYWRELVQIPDERLLAHVFQDEEKIFTEIGGVVNVSHGIQRDALFAQSSDLNTLFLCMIKMEYVLLHPSFISLFRFAALLPGLRSMEEEYNDHITHLSQALTINKTANPMFPVFGELLERIWKETNRLVSMNQADVLTGVLNRRGFYEQVRPLSYLSLRRNYTIAVIILDIDRFKLINDNHGHGIGGRILGMVAQFIKNTVRKSDIVARYGGDEFIVFFSDVQEDDLVEMAQKIQAGIDELSGAIVSSSVSIGIAFGMIGEEPETAVERPCREADAALYGAKQDGRNTFRIRALG